MTPSGLLAKAHDLAPGILLSATIGMASVFVSDHYGGPTLLFALLIGMAFHSLTIGTKALSGIAFCSRTILRIGVALLGARISLAQIAGLGWAPILLVTLGVAATMTFGVVVARMMGISRNLGVLTGGAVAICGASAALAVSAVLPNDKDRERDTLFTVVGVTLLSTVAMVLYPVLARAFGLSTHSTGLLFGATIHDVAQVVAAGQMVSDEATLVATFTKLLRVALLLPVVIGLAWVMKGNTQQPTQQLVPVFLLAFAALVLVNSAGFIPAAVTGQLASISRWCLILAIAALGMKTSLGKLAEIGWRPLVLLVSETVFLLLLVSIGLRFVRV
jgi:uncharacterized integral membrane protein (TIGR00698 family)